MSFHQIKMTTFATFCLLLMGYLDHVTGNELVFSAAYIIPVAICAWHLGRGAVLAMAFLGGAATWIVDYIGGHAYSHFLFHYWNSFACFVISALVGLVLHRLRHTLLEREEKNKELQEALANLERSTAEIRKLQNGLQTVCAWTRQIKVGEEWMTPEDFLEKTLHLRLTHGISPAGRRKFEGTNDEEKPLVPN